MTVKDRPVADYERGPITAFLRVLGPAIAVVGIATILIGYAGLPATVPTHFGISGQADEFGPRWSVLAVALSWAVVQAAVALLAANPRIFNYPTPVTSVNAQRIYREGERMMVWLGLAVATTFAGITALTFGAPGLALTVLGSMSLLAATIVGIMRCLRAG